MTLKNFQTILAAVACVGIVCPPAALAAEPAGAAKDVALRPGGVLVGQVIDQQGAVQVGSEISIQHDQQEVVRTKTDANGIFAAQGLRGGQYQIIAQDGQSFCRLWAADTAPPAASDAAVIVTGQEVVRGQWGAEWGTEYGGRWLDWVRSHPYITAGVVAAAIAAPLAVAATSDDNGPNS
ncbi:MAG: carboxypeptidase-like regulatory domain-containing protein [Pirellulales bacterium]